MLHRGHIPQHKKGKLSSHKCTHTWKDSQHTKHTNTRTQKLPPKGLTPPGWLEAFVCVGQRLSQLRWCHCRLSHGSKPLSSRTTTKKSLCSIEPTCIGENKDCFRSFLFQHVTFSPDFTLSLVFLLPPFGFNRLHSFCTFSLWIFSSALPVSSYCHSQLYQSLLLYLSRSLLNSVSVATFFHVLPSFFSLLFSPRLMTPTSTTLAQSLH